MKIGEATSAIFLTLNDADLLRFHKIVSAQITLRVPLMFPAVAIMVAAPEGSVSFRV
ncbi:hypothetical protein [Syntrophomonas wolfei]|jgi:hypothetical protein|uniref:hypothetical protein n=1 Tax=Syntrophomonas wolfei TaxID=863 RepID=UPI0002E6A98B|nr:hypothetical protein [Syntrophomonas wolfei]